MDRRVAQKCWKPYLIRETDVLVGQVDKEQYIHTAVDWARLWTLIWDSMFALGAVKPIQMEQIEVIDAKILHAQRHTHQTLQWNTSLLPEYLEPETQIRSRLAVFVGCFSLLRVLC